MSFRISVEELCVELLILLINFFKVWNILIYSEKKILVVEATLCPTLEIVSQGRGSSRKTFIPEILVDTYPKFNHVALKKKSITIKVIYMCNYFLCMPVHVCLHVSARV